jgi:hypothetical protein
VERPAAPGGHAATTADLIRNLEDDKCRIRPSVQARWKWNTATKFYVVGRSRTSAAWSWAVDVDAHTVRGGQAASEAAAIKAAERLIDGVLAPGRRRLTLVGPSGDGRS